MKEAIDQELSALGIALDSAAVRKVAEAAAYAVMQFFIVGAIQTTINKEKN